MRISDWSSDVCSSDLDALDLIALIDLEIDHRIAELLVEHRAQIGFGLGIFAAAAGVARHAAAKGDALKFERLAQLLPLAVEALADAKPPIVGIDAHLHAIEDVAIGVVAGAEAAAADRRPAMVGPRRRPGHAPRRAEADAQAYTVRAAGRGRGCP